MPAIKEAPKPNSAGGTQPRGDVPRGREQRDRQAVVMK